MSITKEHAEQLKDKYAVVCCRTVKGSVLTAADLEDPSIFDDLQDSGLITLTPEVLTIGEVLGATLTKDVDALTGLTNDMLEGVTPRTGAQAGQAGQAGHAAAAPAVAAPAPGAPAMLQGAPAMLHIRADSVTGLDLCIPVGLFGGALPAMQGEATAHVAAPGQELCDEVSGTLEKRHFAVKEVALGKKTSFADGVLTLRQDAAGDAMKAHPLVKKLEIKVITPAERHIYSDTIMDVIPIAAKVEGELGEGVTHMLDNVVVVLTGIDEDGKTQVHEFGSSDGFMDETIVYGRAGCPDPDDIMIRVHCVLEHLTGMERRGPMAAHAACDHIIQEVREVIKGLAAGDAVCVETKEYVRRHGRPRVLLVKEVMGQGAMHDNILLPFEPAGVPGGRPNVDLGNVPVVFHVNEVRDGGIHALCCIGPASKEMTRHYFREPIVEVLANDEEIHLVGVAFVGSPQVNDEKTFVSKRLGALAETMAIDGAIVTTEGFGNNHIDFASHIEQLGKRGIKTVGVTFAAYQGQLIVGNQYMDAMVELNKDAGGFESEKLGENTLTEEDARRALQMLKNKLGGVSIAPPENKWSQEVVDANKKLLQ